MAESSATELVHWSYTSVASLAPFPAPSNPTPLVIAQHASVYLVQLLATDCGQVCSSSLLLPIRQLLWTNFPAKLFFFSFQWLNQDQEAVRYTEPQLAKEWGECPGELSVPITSDYLQFYPKDVEGGGKKKPQTAHSQLFIQSKTSMAVFDFENVPTGLSPYQSLAVHWSLHLAPGLFSVWLWMRLSVLVLRWCIHHQLIYTSSAK